MLNTPPCRAPGIDHPILCAGIGEASGFELTAAVNLVLPLLRRGQIEACFDERGPVLVLF